MPKKIIVCCDGTWNGPDQEDGEAISPTNVVKFASALLPFHPDEKKPQVVYYHDGVGVLENIAMFKEKLPLVERGALDVMKWSLFGGAELVEIATGFGIDKIIEDCYRFLMNNYEENDELYLFGFSRGAYTVRSLAGFIRNSGLLKRNLFNKFQDAYQLYRDRREVSHPREKEATNFRQNYSWEPKIKVIGVWDTVGSLGIPDFFLLRNYLKTTWEFHDVKLSTTIEYAFQALAIDERRGDFKPCLWQKQTERAPGVEFEQTLEQVWFPGVHCDVGGGYLESGLSDCSLQWLIAKSSGRGLLAFDMNFVKDSVLGNPLGEMHDSRSLIPWKLRPMYVRQLDRRSNSNEWLSQCAKERREGNIHPAYDPDNLRGIPNRAVGLTPTCP